MASSNSKIGQKLIACWTISTSTCPFEADRCRFTNMQHSRFGWGQIRTWIFSFLTLQTCMEVGPTRVNPIQDSNRGNLRIHFSLCWNKLMQHLTKSNAVLFFCVWIDSYGFEFRKLRLEGANTHWRLSCESHGKHALRISQSISMGTSFEKRSAFLFCQGVCQMWICHDSSTNVENTDHGGPETAKKNKPNVWSNPQAAST